MVCAGSAGQLLVRASSSGLGRQLRACGRALDVSPRAHRLLRRPPSSSQRSRMMASAAAEGGAGHQQPMPVDDRLQLSQPTAFAGSENGTDRRGSCASERWQSEDGKVSWGCSSLKGRRGTMEDCYDIKRTKIEGQEVSLFGVFDGHGGSGAAEYLKEHLLNNLLRHPLFMTDTKLAISEAFQRTDEDFLESDAFSLRDDGSTASAAVLIGNSLYVANVGDSRAVISKAGKAIPLSEDHKPNRSDERQRIEDAGGFVIWAGTWRVGGVLAMSRAFGNRLLKPAVVAVPDVQEAIIDGDLECLVLATDGLWDVFTNQEAVDLAISADGPEDAAQKLTDNAFSRFSTDNITCIVVQFHHDKTDMDG